MTQTPQLGAWVTSDSPYCGIYGIVGRVTSLPLPGCAWVGIPGGEYWANVAYIRLATQEEVARAQLSELEEL